MSAVPGVNVERNAAAEMRDGTVLYADIYRPDGDGPWPVVLMRSPYEKMQGEHNFGTYQLPSWYAQRGYLVVSQDTRGRYESEGDFYTFRYEEQDGYDTVEWAARLPGANGKVGMYGFSYVGATQLLAAVAAPPSLVCICPAITSSDYYEGWAYRGGAFALAFNASWATFLSIDTAQRRGDSRLMQRQWAQFGNVLGVYPSLPLKEFPNLDELAPYYSDWVEHESYDDYWKQWSIEHRYEQIGVPALHVAGWYDIFLQGTLKNFVELSQRAGTDQSRGGQKLIIGPWWHMPWSSRAGANDFGAEGRHRIDEEQIRWFDYWLKGQDNGYLDEPRVKIFVMGVDRWRDENEWPLARTQYVNWYFHSGGRANTMDGDGQLNPETPDEEPPDVYTYDPRNPVPSLGGRSCCYYPIAPMGGADRTGAEIRPDVLVYTSEVLEDDVEVTGPVTATLHAATSARDTDWVVKLIDLYPDGRPVNVAEGILRARYRNSLEVPELLEPDRVYEFVVDLIATSNVFQAGHRIRVEVTSSDFPQFDRNPNTGQRLGEYDYVDFTTAVQTVFHNATRASHIRLPVIP